MKRNTSIDLLRILAAFSVVMLHASAQNWYTTPVASTEWFIINAYDALFRFGVPIFVMVSGALFLSSPKAYDVKRLYQHNILRMFVLYLVWSFGYGLYDCFKIGFQNLSTFEIFRSMLQGRYHLWFLPMIICLYMLIPILKTWVTHATDKEIKYFCQLFILFQVIRTTIRCYILDTAILNFMDGFKPDIICSYAGYFVLGYFLYQKGLSKKYATMLYIAFPFCCLANILLSTSLSRKYGVPNGTIYDCYCIFTFLITITLFHLFANVLRKKEYPAAAAMVISEISADTLGIYMLHIGIMESQLEFILQIKQMPAIYGVPFLAVVCFLLAMLPTMLLRRIPTIGRYLV